MLLNYIASYYQSLKMRLIQVMVFYTNFELRLNFYSHDKLLNIQGVCNREPG